jgi:membrane protein DedA with SNARE-associated domain
VSFLASFHIADLDYSWLAQFFSLLVLPFASEDIAIVLGAYIVVNDLMPAGFVAASIFGGMVASDFALYGIGAGARRLSWLGRWAIDDRVRSFAEMFRRNLFGLAALCRLVPGAGLVAFIACGWARVPLTRFAIASASGSALYLAIVLYLVVVFGDALDDHVGLWTWPAIWCALAATAFVRGRVFAFGESAVPVASRAPVSVRVPGAQAPTPALAPTPRTVQRTARLPMALVHVALILTWICCALRYRSLTLPMVVNPRLPNGGLWDESISDYFLDAAASERHWIAGFTVVTRRSGPSTLFADLNRALESLQAARIDFPLVAKPDRGDRGRRVRRIADVAGLRDYLRDVPGGARLILQRLVPFANEATVLYARMPGEARGRILSILLRPGSRLLGEDQGFGLDRLSAQVRSRCKGRSGEVSNVPATAEHELDRAVPLVRALPAHHQGSDALRCDGRDLITPALEARIDAIARSISEFHYGRFDLRFASVDGFARGESFSITRIEGIRGAMSEARDPLLPLAATYRHLVDQQRILFLLGAKNRARGFAPAGLGAVLRRLVRQGRHGHRFPASE